MTHLKSLTKILGFIFIMVFPHSSSLAQYNDLFDAVKSGDIATLQKAKDKGIKLSTVRNGFGRNLLFYIKDQKTANFLIKAGVNPDIKDSDGWTPLNVALLQGKREIVKALLKAGANPDIKDSDGETPLHRAVYQGNSEIVKTLLKAGANPDIKDSDGETPLHRAVYRGKSEIVKALLKTGANPDIKKSNGWTPLHRAVYQGKREIIKALLKAGANPDIKDSGGWTPLHIAVYRGKSEIVKALLKAGANRNLKNRNGKRPVAYALNNKIVSMLGKDDFVKESEKLLNKRARITSSFNYKELWLEDVSVLFVGETHDVPKFQVEVAKFIREFKKAGVGLTHYATEFITKREQSVIDVYQYTPLPREKFSSRLEYGYAEIEKTAKNNRVKIIGLDIGAGMKQRNRQWSNILMGILEKNSKAKILVHCGLGHSGYDYQVKPVSLLLKDRGVKVRVITLSGANRRTAKRMNISHEYFVAIVPKDKAQLLGADFIINVPESDTIPIPEELIRPILLPWESPSVDYKNK